MSLQTESLLGVPIMAAGGPYNGRDSGAAGDRFTRGDLQLIAANTNALADELRVPVKIGHSREQRLLRDSGLYVDEQPAAGWLTNFRVEGDKLYTDIKAVPKKLAQLVKSGAFRTRSVELNGPVKSQRTGRVYDAVVTALALLGAKAPAIRTLDDIHALYSAAYAEGEEPTRAVRGIDGKVHVLPASTADAMEQAIGNAPGRITEEQYRDYAIRTGVIKPSGYMRSVV